MYARDRRQQQGEQLHLLSLHLATLLNAVKKQTSALSSYSGTLWLKHADTVLFLNTCIFSEWLSLLNSSERNDASVVVYPRYMSEKAVWKDPNQSNHESVFSIMNWKKKSINLHHFVRLAVPGCLQPEISSVQQINAPAGCFWRAGVAATAAPQTLDMSDWITTQKAKEMISVMFLHLCSSMVLWHNLQEEFVALF